jgi:dTDP-4-dehydrorhamnose reductase
MKVLVTGVKGQLGFDVCKHLSIRNISNKGVDLEDFDLTNRQQTFAAITSYSPDAIVHCAAYTAVDKAETNKDTCHKVNVDGTRHVAEAAKYLNAKMIYISTDYVFDGQGNTPFEVNDPIKPQNVYGITKAQGEEAVRSLLEKYFIVRISWAFGINGNNFIKAMLKLGAEKDSLSVVNDQIGSPTYTDDLAPLLFNMLETEQYGTYHATNEGFCSRFDFAAYIMAQAKLACELRPVTTQEYPTPAKRPLNSRLSKESLDKAGFLRLPPWQDSVRRFLTYTYED